MALILDGKKASADIRAEVKAEAEALASKGISVKLTVVIVGENPASQVYVRNKAKACEQTQIVSDVIRLPEQTSQAELEDLIAKLNADKSVNGILVQLPLPKSICENDILNLIAPTKDVDAFSPYSMGRLLSGNPNFAPCTPSGIIELLSRNGIDLSGKNVVIFGRSNIVGKPLAVMMMQKAKGANATVTVCHTATKDPALYTRSADIVVAAVGSMALVKADMIKDGAVVVDVGMNRIPDSTKKSGSRLVGDVDFEECEKKASAITPVPGGVGPMTIAMLLKNTIKAAKIQNNLK